MDNTKGLGHLQRHMLGFCQRHPGQAVLMVSAANGERSEP
jgi:hypothetical protein